MFIDLRKEREKKHRTGSRRNFVEEKTFVATLPKTICDVAKFFLGSKSHRAILFSSSLLNTFDVVDELWKKRWMKIWFIRLFPQYGIVQTVQFVNTRRLIMENVFQGFQLASRYIEILRWQQLKSQAERYWNIRKTAETFRVFSCLRNEFWEKKVNHK